MSGKKSLVQKLVNIMGKVDRIPKRGRNDYHKYDYVTEADIAEHVRKFMVEEGVLMFMDVLEATQVRDDIVRLRVRYTFVDADSSDQLTFIMYSDGQDKNDKGVYKAMTGGEKYALMKTLLIPTGDDPERDDESDKGKAKGKKQEPKQEAPPANKPADKDNKYVTEGQRKAIEAWLKEAGIDREGFKRWAAGFGRCDVELGQLSMNKLYAQFAKQCLDRKEEAKNACLAFLGNGDGSATKQESAAV